MKKLKTAIIGAGIIGLYLAWKLSQQGHQVTVFEKKGKIGKEVCSGLFSERIVRFIPESWNLIQNEIHSVFIHFPRRTLKVNFSKKFFVMDHFKLDNIMADLAETAGAEINLDNEIKSLPEGFDRIIGCDGANSAIRKILKLPNPDIRLSEQGFIPKEDYSDTVETWPVKNGFIWKIPRGRETEYGFLGPGGEGKESFEKYIKNNNLQLERIKAAVVPQGFSVPADKNVALCGDATGLCKPWSGGGVIWGLISADLLLKNFPDFLRYNNQLKTVFLPKIILSKIATKTVYFLGFNFPWLIPNNVKIESDFLF